MQPLVLTMGEPAGIGPDITLMAWQALRHDDVAFAVIGAPALYRERAKLLGLEVAVAEIDALSHSHKLFRDHLPVLPLTGLGPVEPGKLDLDHAPQVRSSIEQAVDLVRSGGASAVVTNPIHKSSLYQAGFEFQGHTDFLAALCADPGETLEVSMMLAGADLRCVPLTIHIPLQSVPQALTFDKVVAQAQVVVKGLQNYFGIDQPRLAFAGLNPHAGEGGAIGCEEQDVLVPAIERLRQQGLSISGPLPADTMFHEEARQAYDVALCAYHDQALIPIKTLDFHGGVNVTLGLPIVRTSPDHGTALALAGKGEANPASLIAAIERALSMAEYAQAGSSAACKQPFDVAANQ